MRQALFVQSRLEVLAMEFLQASAGDWRSQRRYYTLTNGTTQEVESLISIRFIEEGAPELQQLAQMQELEVGQTLICGSQITWESNYLSESRKPMTGATIIGVLGDILYRDRGFATLKPVTAKFRFPDPKTMHLRTEYEGSVFEEEIKLIGKNYRTRQTIIARAGEEQMIGQYLETRLNS